MRLAVSGGQPLVSLGLPMFAFSLEYFISLPWGPSTLCRGAPVPIWIFSLPVEKIIWRTNKIFKKIHVGLKLEWGLLDKYWLSWKRLLFEFFFQLPLWCPFGSNLWKHACGHSVTTEACSRAPHLPGSVWYGGLQAHWSYLHYRTFEVPHKISYPYIERYICCTKLKF